MKKVLVLAFVALFSSIYTNVWGVDYVKTDILRDGEYVIGAVKGSATATNIYAFDKTDNATWGKGTDTNSSGGKISNPSNDIIWILTTLESGGFALRNKANSKYIKLTASTGSGSMRINSDEPAAIYRDATGNNSTYEISGSPSFSVSSGNQLGYKIGSGYQIFTNRTHEKETDTGNTSILFRFYRKSETYTVTYNAGTGTCATTSATEASAFSGVTLPSATAPEGWSFVGWATASVDETKNSPTLYKAGDTYYPTSSHTLYAVYAITSNNYRKVTSTDSLSPGKYLVVNTYYGRAMKAAVKSTYYLDTTHVTISNNTIINPVSTIIWEVTNKLDTYQFYNISSGKWLDNYFGTNHYLQLLSSKGKGYRLTINGSGNAVFSSNNDAGAMILYPNSTYKFAGGAKGSTSNVQLYKQDNTYNSNPTSCSDFAFWYGTTKTEEDKTECFTQVGTSTTWLTDLWTIPSADQWTYVGEPFWNSTSGKSANLQLSNMPYALNHANNLGTIGTNVMEGAQGYIKINDDSNDANRYVGFIPAGYVLRWGSANDGSWTSKVFSPASEDIEEEDWNTELHEWTSSNAMDTTFVALKTSDDYVWSNRSETRVSVFFKPNANWLTKDGEGKDCKFAIYYYTEDETHNGWSAFMTDPDGDGIYEAWIPKDYVYTKVIFVRFPNSKASTGDWSNEYNQTGNLTLPSDKNVFTLAEGKWGTEADEGSWSLYNKKGTFHISANSDANNWYCHFLPHYVITFDANSGEDAPEPQSVAINASPCQITVTSDIPTRDGYYFLGWSTNSEASSPDGAWDPEDTHTMTEDVTLYAVWEPAVVTFEATTNANWNTAGNWDPNFVPNINTDVILNKPVTVNTTAARAKSVVINQTTGNSGQLVVDAGQKLIVAGSIQKTTNGETYSATEANDIIINSDATHGLGALVMGTHDGTNQATVNFTTLSSGTSEDDTSIAQYVGTPFNDETNILHNWYNSWVYGIDHTEGIIGWERVNEGQGMTPFKGYCVFSADGIHHNYWQQGKLVASENQTISSLNWQSGVGTANPNNENLLANSWMAPIKIHAMEASDFPNTEATIYIFNSTSASGYEKGGFASNYTGYTPGTAGEAIIPSMQSFSVFTNAAGGSSVRLDYNKIVYQPALSGTVPGPNRAPLREAAGEANKIRLFVRTEGGYGDLLYMWERSDFSEAFENGWDGHKLFGESVAPQLFALSPDGDLAINCIPTFEGVQMGFKAGEQDNSYTLTFEYSDEAQPLYLLDIQTNIYTQITSDTSYSFTTTDTEVHNRFVLTYNAPSAPTALETTPAVTTGKKVMYDNHLFILHNGRIFSAQGAMIQ